MIIENIKKSRSIKAIFVLIPLTFIITVVALLLLSASWGFWIVLSMAILMITIYIFISMMQYNYFYCEIDNAKIILKYYGLGPLNKEYKTIKVSTEQFKKFEIRYVFFGLVEQLIIYVSVKNKQIAKYPPVSISALSAEEKNNLKKELANLYKKSN